MAENTQKKNKLLLCLMWLFEGIFVGVGAILPGISGGTLLVAFGMYRPIIETLSSPIKGIKKYWLMMGVFALGIGTGFVGLSGLAAILLEKNTVLVTCAFAGFIMGTFPELWRDAGEQGRKKTSYVSLLISFALMLGILTLLKTTFTLTIAPGIGGFLLCGVLWGFSLIIPGLSSSSLLLFFGLYQPMLEGISGFDFKVLVPMGISMLACILLLSKVVGYAYKKWYSLMSHGVLGIVAATAVMILPFNVSSFGEGVINSLLVIGGALVSFGFSCLCSKIAKKQ